MMPMSNNTSALRGEALLELGAIMLRATEPPYNVLIPMEK
ncbi:MAG: hypothetical protein RLZZ511_114 [Cyanobacteriota bacterium]